MTALARAVGELGREQAREAAREELARRPYQEAQPPLLVRAVGRLLRELGELLERVADAAPGGALGAVLLLLLVALGVGAVLVRLRPARSGAGAGALFEGTAASSADDHRRRADMAAAHGDYAEAVRERLRAVVRELEARGVLDPRPGRTADEAAREAGAVMPVAAADLQRAARTFDEVWYGGRPADASSYALLVAVDERLGELLERRLVAR